MRIEETSFGPDLRWDLADLMVGIGRGRIIVCQYRPSAPILGYAAVRVQDGVGRLNSVAVRPEARGKGLGGVLVSAAIDRMRRGGAECVELECDTDLVGFYRKFGFDMCGFYTTGIGTKQKARVRMRLVV